MFSMDLSIRQSEHRVVIALHGELDVTDAASAASALIALAARDCEIIVDLAGLEFIDSSGLAALVLARKHARQAGGDLLLAAPQQHVLRVLTITRLIEVFAVHAGPEEMASGAELSVATAPVTAWCGQPGSGDMTGVAGN
jgi:anti-sigma B factor antagonist